MLSFLDGDGRMAAAIRSHDWSGTPLGPAEDWPAALKTAVSLVLNSHFPQCIAWGPSLTTIPNDAFLPILGEKVPALGRPFDEVWSEAWSSLEPFVAAAFAGDATYIEDFPLIIDRLGYPEQAYFTFCYSPIRDELGKIVGMLDTVTETTGKVELFKRQQVLSSELGHRLKNLLAVVQAVASQTLRQSTDLAAANEALTFRLAAFGRAADVLTASHWNDADLRALIHTTMATHEGMADRFIIDGPPMRLKSEVALGLTLALHELVTNATKYGALSNDAGRVHLTWTIDDGDEDRDGTGEKRFRMVWRETGGPVVHPPSRRGFGSVMVERTLRSYVRGETTARYHADGLVFELDAPLSGAQAKGDAG